MKVKIKVTQSCPTLCDHMDYSPWNSPGQHIGVSIPCFPGDLPNLQVDFLPAEPQGKPI